MNMEQNVSFIFKYSDILMKFKSRLHSEMLSLKLGIFLVPRIRLKQNDYQEGGRKFFSCVSTWISLVFFANVHFATNVFVSFRVFCRIESVQGHHQEMTFRFQFSAVNLNPFSSFMKMKANMFHSEPDTVLEIATRSPNTCFHGW